MPVVGQCKLCLRSEVELQESHFIPKAAYKAVQKLAGVTPLNVRGEITVQKNDQITAFLLCATCEDRFNKNGENWVISHCNRPGSGFKLYDLLQTLQPVRDPDEPDLKMYAAASIAEIDASKLAYFVLSVLWRGSIHNWRWGKDELHTDRLGTKYEDEFRRYLLGESDFPQNVAIHVFVLEDSKMWDGFTIPFRQKLKDGLWRYTFVFLGISFRCLLGNVMDAKTRSACVYQSPQKYIFCGNAVDKIFVRDFAPTLLKAKRVGRKLG
jgi:hypothetical protein